MVPEDRLGRFGLHSFVALSCALSWTLWGLIISSARGWLPFSVPLNPWGSFGPAVAAIILVSISEGIKGIHALIKPLISWRFGISWWLIVLGGPFALVGVSVIVFPIAGNELSLVPSIPWGQMVLLLPIILVVGGPLGEEIGWRGFALPRLLMKHDPITASLIVAGIWMLWHAPLFWVPGATQEGSSVPVFLATVVAISILMTWIYLGTARSLLAPVMFHFSINVTTYFLPMVFRGIDFAGGFEIVYLIVVWVVAVGAMFCLRRMGRVEQKGEESALGA